MDNNLKITKDFLRKNKDLMCTNADKGNISVLMRRSEYIRDMEELLHNVENFEIFNQDPLKKLKSSSFRMAANWRKRGLLRKDTRWRDIDTTNAVLAICYGLRKIHKKKSFSKDWISLINSTKFKFNGKFYKQKFGTPIGSLISPMLAEIVMEDLERSVFERLGFVLPLEKLQIVIDTFNDYHQRIQFTHEMERNNRISFQIEFEPVSLQTQIPFNVQTNFHFKIPRTRNRSNPKKNDQIWTQKHYPNQTNMRKTNKKGGKTKEGNLPKPLPRFSFFRYLLSLFTTRIYIKIKSFLNF